jgi:prepilin peptidase CpaA
MGLMPDTVPAILTALSVALSAAVLLAAALHDIAFRTVPNWMPAVLFLAGCLARGLGGTLLAGLAIGLAVFLGGMLCWHRGWLGGGDVKLLAATAVVVPPVLAASLLLDVALSGGILAILYLALGQFVQASPNGPRPPGLLRRIWRAERFRICRRGPLPYASAIVAGAFLVLFKG